MTWDPIPTRTTNTFVSGKVRKSKLLKDPQLVIDVTLGAKNKSRSGYISWYGASVQIELSLWKIKH
jgi:hypothetical protein